MASPSLAPLGGRALEQQIQSPATRSWWSVRPALTMAAIVALFLAMGIAISLTRAPWWDEGMLADPAYNLALHGHLGSAVMNEYGHRIVRHFPGYGRYTYWTVPLYLVVLAGWIKAFGASVLAMRILSLLCGVVLIWTARVITRILSGNEGCALLAALLVATDYTVLLASVTIRMDAMTAALGFGAIAVYLSRREKNFGRAILIASTLAAAAVFSHPVGLLHTGGLLLTALFFDRRRLRIQHFLLAAIPYLAFTALWGAYIAQAPNIFWAQITAHAAYRVGGLTAPLRSLLLDWRDRYVFYFSAPGVGRLKILILVAYAAGLAGGFWFAVRRRNRGLLFVCLLAVLYYAELAILDHEQFPHYMLNVITPLAIVLSMVILILRRDVRAPRALLAAALAVFILLQLGGHILKIRANTYRNDYDATIAFVEAHATPRTLVIGPTQLFFDLRGKCRLVDDARLGELSGLRPQMIVLDSFHPGPSLFETREPETARWVSNVLSNRFRLVASYGEYKIYLPKS